MNRCDTIGVIVPVYNNRPDLGQCVDSILAQTWPSLHLYLIDDGSADGSSAILDRYASDYPAAENAGRAAESASGGDFVFRAVTVVHKGNEGPGMTALRGIRESREEYLCFVDADDWIDSDMIANLAERRSFACPEVICANYVIEREWNGKSERVTNALPPGEYVGQRLETEVRRRILGNEHRIISVSRCMKLFSRALFADAERYMDPALRLGEDLCMIVPVLLRAERIAVLEGNYTYHYRFRRDSAVHGYRRDMERQIRLLDGMIRRILEDRLGEAVGEDAVRAMADREYLYHFILLMKNELRNPGTAFSAEQGREVPPGVYIRELLNREGSRELAERTGEKPEDAANRLIIWMMRRPTAFRIAVIRRIFLIRAAG